MSKINNVRSGSGIKQPTQQNGDRLGENSVASEHIQDLAVTEAKFGNDVISTVKIQDGAVTTDKINNDAVITAKINDGAVTASKVSSSIVITTGAQDIYDKTIKNNLIFGHVTTQSAPLGSNTKVYADNSKQRLTAVSLTEGPYLIDGRNVNFASTTSTLTTSNQNVFLTNGGNITLTLPTAGTMKFRSIRFYQSGSGSTIITDSITNWRLSVIGDCLTLISDGSSWRIESIVSQSKSVSSYSSTSANLTTGWVVKGSISLPRGIWLLTMDAMTACASNTATIMNIAFDSVGGTSAPATLINGLTQATVNHGGGIAGSTLNLNASLSNYEIDLSAAASNATTYYIKAKSNTITNNPAIKYFRFTAIRLRMS